MSSKAQRRKLAETRLAQLETDGFDASYISVDGEHVRVKCSQCDALAINGVPCHEIGCPHEMHECNGCNAVIPVRQRYCVNCQ